MSLEPKKISALTETQRINTLRALRNYDSYIARFQQSGTDNPVVTVMENTGVTGTWVRNGMGSYKFVFATPIDRNKTHYNVSTSNTSATDPQVNIEIEAYDATGEGILISVYDNTGTFVELDGAISFQVEIRIYF